MSPLTAYDPHSSVHVAHIVERVEDAEDIDAGGAGVDDEALQDIVWVVAVADDVLPAQKHHERGVGHALLQASDAIPGVLVQEAHRRVECGAAPHLDGPEADLVDPVGDREHVVCAHPSSQQ